MDERVLGDVPSEGSESGRRFGIYRENNSDLKMRSVSWSVVLFVIAVVAIIALSIFYPVMEYASKSKTDLASPKNNGRTDNVNLTKNLVRQDNASSNCSTQIFSFGHDCSEPYYLSSTEDHTNLLTTETDITTAEIRRFDETSVTHTEDNTSEIETDLEELKDFKFERSGRSNWPLVSTPYPYYKPTPISTAAGFEEKGLSFQETNIFAIPTDLSSDKYDSTTSRVNLTTPPYVFPPYPNFTGSYAQLSPYKVPQNNSNFVQVMKYLNTNVPSERHFTEQSKTTSREKNTIMKISGTYLMPLDRRRPGEIILTSNSDNIEEARPFFNGHAYFSDPFNKYRPTNPSDINRLIPVKSSLDTGPRFRKPVSFVPTSSIPVDITQPASHSDRNNKYRNSGSHTVAIFHPPAVVSPKPPTGLSTPSAEGQHEKPLSVVLDIYPVTVESELETADESSSPTGRERGRLNPKWKLKATERPKWRPQLQRRPTSPDDTTAKNHMIVHLNLFPNKRKPYSMIRRNRPESTTESKTTTLQGGQFESRNGQETAELRGFSDEETERTTQPLNTSTETSLLNSDPPAFSALERSNEEEEEVETTSTDDFHNIYYDEENTTEYNNESNPSTLEPVVIRGHNSEQSFSTEKSVDGLLKNQSTELNTTTVI